MKTSGVTATTFLPKYPPSKAIGTTKNGPGWSPDLSVKQRQCITIDLGHVASVHGWMTMGAKATDGTYGYVKYYTVDVSVDGMTWRTRELRHKPGVARVRVYVSVSALGTNTIDQTLVNPSTFLPNFTSASCH